ncbi:RNA-directed DNA polymerase (reverse transcriptase)-related family protein [Abeliophyllum distichum]|uniref:RNA-directed DNA polymerase (Reverse transcriptase)-related family protein n=1 Tax=Abeliophyllum distichum TaxID=126358 RepID=A0ABD1VY71_9LAMI
MLHTLDIQARGDNFILKLNMDKAYDRYLSTLLSLNISSSLSHTWAYRKTFLYDDLLQKVKSRISGRAFRLLSSGGRITLLSSVLSSLLLYLLQIMQPSKTVLKKLESTFARFLWNSKDQAHRMHWRRWKDICLPTDDGGLGFRRLEDVVQAFSLKL